MTVEELQAEILRLNEANKDLTSQLQGKDELLEGFKAKEAQHLEKASQYQEQIMKLRDMNTDLFLRVSQPITTQNSVEDEPQVSQEESISLEDILG